MQKLFIATGKVAHYVDTRAPRLPGVPIERAPALCSLRPLWPGMWSGSNGDSAVADQLPMCRTCESLMEALVNARPA